MGGGGAGYRPWPEGAGGRRREPCPEPAETGEARREGAAGPTPSAADARERRLEHLARQARRLALTLERMRVGEFVRLTERPRHLLYVNFLAGLGRGLGIAVGFSLLGALLIYFLRRTVMLNLPGIGSFIAELVMIVQSQIRP